MSALVRALASVTALALALVACASSDDGGFPSTVGSPCSLSSDCPVTQVCAFARCRFQCTASDQCPMIATDAHHPRCIRSDQGKGGVCTVDDESECTSNTGCPLGKVCALDYTCHDGCLNDGDCLGSQSCIARVCADDGELPDAATSDSGTRIPCTHTSDCSPVGLTCIDGFCARECAADVDCGEGATCSADGHCQATVDPTCPNTCASKGYNCGVAPSGCGEGVLLCGSGDNDGCPLGQTCGGSGSHNFCGPGTCTPRTCAELGRSCGVTSDGCSRALSCGTCPEGQSCNGNGACVCERNPDICLDRCGVITDNCGDLVDCGGNGCRAGFTCGEGGVCGCTPTGCGDTECGQHADGCGGFAPCTGQCTGDTPACKSDGTNRCDATCTMATCTFGDCGDKADGCGGILHCGGCQDGAVCGKTTPNRCECQAKVCRPNVDCGRIADGCGLTMPCGDCAAPFTCGGGGVANTCGCTRHTCADVGATCGYVDDGCGTLLPCGTVSCGAGEVCGGGGTPNVCAVPTAPGSSCRNASGQTIAAGCGPNGDDDCCAAQQIPEGLFQRYYWDYETSRIGGGPTGYAADGSLPTPYEHEGWTYPAHVSRFALDAYEVTVGRYRRYLDSGGFTRFNPPPVGAGRNPNIPQTLAETGWRAEWNQALPSSAGATAQRVGPEDQACNAYQLSHSPSCTLATVDPFTYTAQAGALEAELVVGLSWYEAFAFCIWDGGRLPTDSEWLYAAAGGPAQLAYPWGNEPLRTADVMPVPILAGADSCSSSNGTFCGAGRDHHVRVGSRGPNALGLTGLFGLGLEWTLDTRAAETFPQYDCTTQDCAWTVEPPVDGAYLPLGVVHRVRGGIAGYLGNDEHDGGFCGDGNGNTRWADTGQAAGSGSPQRQGPPACTNRSSSMVDPIGFRCARDLR